MGKVIEYSRKRFSGKPLSFNLTTNGTLLTEETILFFDEHDVSIMISLDGSKKINDENRVFLNGEGTYDAVIQSIELVKKVAPEYAAKLNINMVINPENDFDCINEVCLKDSDIDALSIIPSMVDLDYSDNVVSVSEEYSSKSEYQRFLALLAVYGRYPKSHISPIAGRTVERMINEEMLFWKLPPLRGTDAPSGPCIPGQFRLFITTSGVFLPCERVSEVSPAMVIGNLKEGFNYANALQMLNIGYITKEECCRCWCFRYCELCVKKADCGTDGLSAQRKLSYCNQTKARVYSKLRGNLLLKEVPVYYKNQTRALRRE
jgi:uncharacterized protein